MNGCKKSTTTDTNLNSDRVIINMTIVCSSASCLVVVEPIQFYKLFHPFFFIIVVDFFITFDHSSYLKYLFKHVVS
jgi:hypothetical protein